MIKYPVVINYFLKHIYFKFVSGPPHFGFIERRLWIWLTFIPLIYIVQRYWSLTAWRHVKSVARPWVKAFLGGILLSALLMVTATVFDMYFWRFLPHHYLSNWIFAGCKLWLMASILGYVSLKLIWAAERVSRLVMVIPSRRVRRFDPARRDFLRYAAFLAGSAPFLLTAYGFGSERLGYKIENIEVPIGGLPKNLDGLRILQLSDIHRSDFMPHYELRRAVDMANGLRPDLAVVTGDLISYRGDPLADCVAELGRLRAPLGVWGCNGNHETYAGVEALAPKLFRQHGMRLLRQESAELAHNGEKINLIGVDYQTEVKAHEKKKPMLQDIEPLIRKDIPNILLSHNPNSFYRAAELGIELSLAGHTHGGQVDLEIVDQNLTPARFFTKFVAGLYHLPVSRENPGAFDKPKSAALYVNRGLGTFGMPVRLGAPPEITLMILRQA